MFVPAGTPRDVIGKLHDETVRALQKPDVKERFTALGVEPMGSTPEYLAKYLQAEITKWASVVKRTGMRPE